MSDPLYAAMQLSEHPDACSALMKGLPVPRSRLRAEMLRRIGEPTSGPDVVLDEDLVLRVEVHSNSGETTSPLTSPRLRPKVPPGDFATSPHPLQGGRGGDLAPDFAPDFAPDHVSSGHSWLPHSLVTLAARPPEPPELVGLFYPGYNHLLSGESEALKTWLVLAAAASELTGLHGVLWVDGDDVGAGALLERLRLLGVGDDVIGRLFAYVAPDEPLDADSCGDVLDIVRERDVRLAVFDGFNPLLNLHGLNPESGTDVERFYRLIDPIRKLGVAAVLTDNVVKAREERGKWAIGSERKKSKAEVHLGMRAIDQLARGGVGKSVVSTYKDRPGHLPRPNVGVFVLDTSSATVSWRIDADDSHDEGGFRPTRLMEKVSRFLATCESPPSRNQLEQEKFGKRDYVRQAIDLLCQEGYAEESQGSRGARLVTFVRLFTEADQLADDEDDQ